MQKRPLGKTGLGIAPLVFGGNVFGWTLDEAAAFNVLDAFVDHGFNAIDTADVYSSWAPGNKGGESETIIGNWLKARPGLRERVVIFTKVGSDMGQPGKRGLSERWILQAAEESLARLGTSEIDLYFSHWPDKNVTYGETLGAYDKLIKAGKVRAIGASNLDAAQLGEALKVAREKNLPPIRCCSRNIIFMNAPASMARCAISAFAKGSASSPISASPPASSPANTARTRISVRASAAAASPDT